MKIKFLLVIVCLVWGISACSKPIQTRIPESPSPSPRTISGLAVQPKITLVAGDSQVIEYTSGGTPFATVVVTAPTLTPTPTATVTPTPTATRTSTPTLAATPTPTQIFLPFIVFNYPSGTPTVWIQNVLMTIRVKNSSGAYVNGAIVKIEVCDVPGSSACASYDTATTITTSVSKPDAIEYAGTGFHIIERDYWYRVTLGADVRTFYVPATMTNVFIEFVQ